MARPGTGEAVYKITYSAAGGVYQTDTTVTFNVVSGGFANLPTGIQLTQDAYSIQPGDAVTLNDADIANADGVLPGEALRLARVLV